MGVKQFKISLPVTLKILIILKNQFNRYGMKKGIFLIEFANELGKSKTTINDVLRFLEEENFIIRKNENIIKMGKKRKENFISRLGLDLLKTELHDYTVSKIDTENEVLKLDEERNYIFI